MRRTLAIVAAAGLLSGLGAQTRLTTSTSRGERLPVLAADADLVAYVALVGGVREVFTVPASGGAAVQRTSGADVWVGSSLFDAWPSLSISDDGNRIAYWNAGGVHVLDLAANSDTVVATASLLPYPQLSGDGTRVVYQAQVSGEHEVFVVNAAGGTPTRLTSASGPGRRLPHVRGSTVVFQRPVAGAHELFTIDLGTQQVFGPHTAGSGHGNRYARLSPDARYVAWEAVLNGAKEAWVAPLQGWAATRITTASLRGDRLPAPTEDDEVFLQSVAANLQLAKVDATTQAAQTLVVPPRAGYRRPSVDRHGTLLVYQADHQGHCEVFTLRLCYPPAIQHYGQHGVPSVGTLGEFAAVERCDYTFGITTGLGASTPAALLVGAVPQAVPIPNAPGNFLYLAPLLTLPAIVAAGRVSITLPSPTALAPGLAYAQWALLDPPANALGIVSSKGVRVQFQ